MQSVLMLCRFICKAVGTSRAGAGSPNTPGAAEGCTVLARDDDGANPSKSCSRLVEGEGEGEGDPAPPPTAPMPPGPPSEPSKLAFGSKIEACARVHNTRKSKT